MRHARLFLLAAMLVPGLAASQPAAPAPKDAALEEGRTLHEKDCVACHARRFDGDAARMYTRADRKVTSIAKLRAQVAYCSTELGKHYFPEEEESLVVFLDRTWYRFPP